MVIIGSLVVFVIAFNQINKYFFPENRTPRSDLLNGSIILMEEHFPLGTGFATYGSYTASEYYSVFYYRFNFKKYYRI